MATINETSLREQEESLRKQVYDLTWASKLWGKDGAIAASRKRYRLMIVLDKKADGLSALASTYYTAAGTAAATAKQARGLKKFWWYLQSIQCLFCALFLAIRFRRTFGLKYGTPDQLDVFGRIFFKARRYRAAIQCTDEALSRLGLTPDTEALLLMGKAELHGKRRERGLAIDVYAVALRHAEDLKPTTLVRLFRSRGQHFLSVALPSFAASDFAAARGIAETHGLEDQLTKLQPLIAEAERRRGKI